MKMLNLLLVISYSICAALPLENLRNAMKEQAGTQFPTTHLFEYYASGALGNVYPDPTELDTLLTHITSEFSDILTSEVIGHTFEQQPIHAYILTAGGQDPTFLRPALLVTGQLNARELTTTSQLLFTLMHLLFDYVNGDS
jgi:hypothetical protein